MSTPATSCAVKPAISARPKVVSVNGTVIPREAIARETQNHPATKPIEAWQAAARALAVRELLLQEARRLELRPTPTSDAEGRRETDDEALIRQLVEREVAVPEPDEATCQRYFEQNRKRFRSPDLYEVAHILIAAPLESDARTKAREQAEALLRDLLEHPNRFGDRAKAHSACPSGQVGGSLGQIGPGQTVPEFEAALGRIPAGAIGPEPIESRYGFHIARVDRRIEGRDLPFEVARPRIAAYLAEHVRRTAIRQYLSLLAGRAVLEGVALDAAQSPLMQ
ncbi:MAG: peptidylprolyl isomerase [Rhizobiales bacterium]|nr:peptidylprolyl isomerase [Hyphomicrobiales bacterium]